MADQHGGFCHGSGTFFLPKKTRRAWVRRLMEDMALLPGTDTHMEGRDVVWYDGSGSQHRAPHPDGATRLLGDGVRVWYHPSDPGVVRWVMDHHPITVSAVAAVALSVPLFAGYHSAVLP